MAPASDTAVEIQNIDPTRFKNAMSQFATGVAVIAAMDGDEPVGFACQSFISLSLDPPLVAFAASKTSMSWPRIAQGGYFSVNLLGHDQTEVCKVFGASGDDKFKTIDWHPSPTGSPIIEGVIAWADCAIEVLHDVGDHEFAVGRVLDLDHTSGEPLIYFQRQFGSFSGFPK